VPARVAAPLALAAILLGNVPGLGIGHELDKVGLSQPWSVFAPDPASRRIELSARVAFADGTRATWRPPHHGAPAAPLDYHWEMWAAWAVRDDDSALWEPAARWIARHSERPSRRVVAVTLRRRWADLPAPGPQRASQAEQFDFYTLDLRRGGKP
jgi:hypothetical protein